MSNYSTPFPTVIDAVIRCLEDALPHLATGAHFGTHSGFMIHGHWADGRRFHGHDSGHGGWGAGDGHDGAGPFRTMAHGDTRLIPMELQESLLPFRVSSLSLREDSRRTREVSWRAGLPQGIRDCPSLHPQHQPRPQEMSALGCARRQGRQVRLHHHHQGVRRDRAHGQGAQPQAPARRPRHPRNRRRRRLGAAGGSAPSS